MGMCQLSNPAKVPNFRSKVCGTIYTNLLIPNLNSKK
jgi:hypothetical protein